MEITRLWRDGSGSVHTVDVTSKTGGRYQAGLRRGEVLWAEPDVWAFPHCHGLERWTCPGHGTHPCFYGACDEIRVADLGRLRILAAALDRQERGALVAH